ncbi:MAG: hypothetical protein H7336_09010 [Bacteriovorax sp.]|nr:hypothetical protein [Bacteriovorax sp.]
MKILVRVISVAAVTISLAHAKSLATAAASQINYLGSGTFYSSRDDSQDYFSLTGQVDCSAHTFKPEPNVLDHIGKLKEITRSYCASTQSLVATRFAAADCAKASTCRHSVGNNNTNLIDADNILNEIIAKDYIKNSLIMYGEDMERLEGLTKFAQKQYDTKLGSQCLARFQRKSISRCDSGFAEQTFTEHQKNCSSGYGCFKSDENNSGVVSFEKFKSSHKDSEGKYMYDYYKYRVETKFNNEISGDDKKLSELGDLVSSAKFKALSLDAKIVRFTSEMGMENDGRLKDPVLGYDLGTGSKEPKRFIASAKFKEVIKLLQDKNVTSTSFAKDFDGLRKKRVQALLSSDDICGSTPTFVKICSEATSILKGGSVKKDANFVDHIASPVTMDDDYLDRIKKILGSDLNSDFFETLVNARRCISFGLTDTQGNPIVTTSKATSGTAGDSGGGSSDRNDMESKGVNPPQQVTPVVQNEPSNMRALYDEAAAKNGGGVEPKSEVAEKNCV